jgi:anti-sigma-K factor RskA
MNVTYAHINAYVRGVLPRELESKFESAIQDDPKIQEIIERKKDELVLINSLIPARKTTKRTATIIQNDLELINDEILTEEKTSFLDKVAKVLDTTVLEF